MVRKNLLKWAASAALACAVPAIGLARHTPLSAAASTTATPLAVAKPATTSATTLAPHKRTAHHRIVRHSKKHHLAAKHATKHKLSTSHKKTHGPA
ncbi:MAG: hypothetical protein JWN24_1537 [Phycisphaerales bacterium]|jgi:hypothetical protein|nr:hypothetical protein [Phycisphaerales bacterium]